MVDARDLVHPRKKLKVYVRDDGLDTVFGLCNKQELKLIKWTTANEAKPLQKPGSGEVDYKLQSKGNMQIYAVDEKGNKSGKVSCLVHPNPK
jgi:hypothetical protein